MTKKGKQAQPGKAGKLSAAQQAALGQLGTNTPTQALDDTLDPTSAEEDVAPPTESTDSQDQPAPTSQDDELASNDGQNSLATETNANEADKDDKKSEFDGIEDTMAPHEDSFEARGKKFELGETQGSAANVPPPPPNGTRMFQRLNPYEISIEPQYPPINNLTPTFNQHEQKSMSIEALQNKQPMTPSESAEMLKIIPFTNIFNAKALGNRANILAWRDGAATIMTAIQAQNSNVLTWSKVNLSYKVAGQIFALANTSPIYSPHVCNFLRECSYPNMLSTRILNCTWSEIVQMGTALLGMSSHVDHGFVLGSDAASSLSSSLFAIAIAANQIYERAALGGGRLSQNEDEVVAYVHKTVKAHTEAFGYAPEFTKYFDSPQRVRPYKYGLLDLHLATHLISQYVQEAPRMDADAAVRVALAPRAPPQPQRGLRDQDQQQLQAPQRERRPPQASRGQPRPAQAPVQMQGRGAPLPQTAPPQAAPPPPRTRPAPTPTLTRRIALVDPKYDFTPRGSEKPADPNFQCIRCGSGNHFARNCPCPESEQHARPEGDQPRDARDRRAGGNR